MFVLALIILTPFVLIGAIGIRAALNRYNVLPEAVSHLAILWIAFLTIFGVILIADGVAVLIVRPTQLQQEFLGRAHAWPAALLSHESWGFQDPGDKWTYALTRQQLAELRPQCTASPGRRSESSCSLGGYRDDRYYAAAHIEGGLLILNEGLH